MKHVMPVILVSIFMQGCMTPEQHQNAVKNDSSDKITVGKVQKEISVGMSGAQVAEVLGSPNIVSTDKDNDEVWIYDKVSTRSASSRGKNGANILILFDSLNFTATSSSQKTLTIIIKFDKDDKVKDFSYRASSF
ncbi:MAG: outer membrane protein assembly factor BamE [Endozoicomonadaceae bacterium]|nr:outer membrane protein assembly factor BamE [Endozoicomonadaceae bacterium]